MGINAFAIAPQNNEGGKNDATGAFHVGALKFASAYNCTWRKFKNTGTQAENRKSFFKEIEDFCPGGVNYFAYFGHGYTNGLGSADVGMKQLDDFIKVLQPKISKPFFMALFACSCGKEQGFSGKIREKLGNSVWIYGHTTVGHTFKNPDISEEASSNSPTYHLLYPYGTELRAPFAEALKYTDLWHRMVTMEYPAIEAELNARRLLGTWEVSGAGVKNKYVFDYKYETWSITSGRAIDEPIVGTVKLIDPKNSKAVLETGSWTITDKVYVSWPSGGSETWPLHLTTAGQPVIAGGNYLTAKRLSRPEGHGKLQG